MLSKLEEKLLEFENETAASDNEEVKAIVNKIIEAEEAIDYEERDYDLLAEANEFLLRLENVDVEALDENADKLFAKAMSELKNKKKVRRSGIRAKWIVPIAAALSLVLISGVVTVAFGRGFDDISKRIYSELKRGVQYILGTDEVAVTDDYEKFNTIEDLATDEKCSHFALPRNLSDEYKVVDILVLYYDDGEHIDIKLEKDGYPCSISIRGNTDWNVELDKQSLGKYEVHLTQYDGVYQGEFVFEGDYYIVTADSYDGLIELIDSME